MKVSGLQDRRFAEDRQAKRQLTFIESRVFTTSTMSRGGAEPGGHAHKVLEEFLVAMSGNVDVVLDDGRD